MQPIGITMGDAAGIGPEIIAAAWNEIVQKHGSRFIIYGNPEIMNRAVKYTGGTAARLNEAVISCGNNDAADVPPGTVDARAGEAAYQAIIRAVDDAKAGKTAAVVTAPIHKEALNLAGYHYPGHTEILAERCGIRDFAMMLYLGTVGKYGLAVDHVTLHCSMKSVFEQITVENVLTKIRLVNDFMRKIRYNGQDGVNSAVPKIGICSLNPHNGENGLFGREELDIINPAAVKARAEGIDVDNSKPADTIMIDAKNGKYDAVVAMFHDQGHIALKLLGMYRAVNVALGLPIIRTSPAHGTAFDIAGKGQANCEGFIEAVNVAVKLI
ncbi:MAG: 4-hydroxythreonine-4-phosphate dehydrogenase PdxA [Planctomycetaceae bacterium]|jgi:4-hydroxythreonine-4-phosphate dehydrogenase|nr:4-hydroxythreonine-4-phosphate dehydrogenase PdxA [Planctomycetaceae bacterium]